MVKFRANFCPMIKFWAKFWSMVLGEILVNSKDLDEVLFDGKVWGEPVGFTEVLVNGYGKV